MSFFKTKICQNLTPEEVIEVEKYLRKNNISLIEVFRKSRIYTSGGLSDRIFATAHLDNGCKVCVDAPTFEGCMRFLADDVEISTSGKCTICDDTGVRKGLRSWAGEHRRCPHGCEIKE